MTLQKKLYSAVLAGAMTLSIGSMTSFASNYSDTAFTFNFDIGTNVAYTLARAKDDNTSAYMKLQKLQGGTNPTYTASVVKENYTNFSKTWYYSFSSANINQGRYLSNYAYEDDGAGVKVRIKATRGADPNGFYGSGLWSPDSL